MRQTGNSLGTSEVRQAEEMVLHQPDVRHHHVQHVFAHRLDVAVQLQLLTVEQHHAHLPLHVLRFAAFLARDEKRGEFEGLLVDRPGTRTEVVTPRASHSDHY